MIGETRGYIFVKIENAMVAYISRLLFLVNRVIRDLEQIATEGSTTVVGSKISWKEPLRMSDTRFPVVAISLRTQEEAFRRSVVDNDNKLQC